MSRVSDTAIVSMLRNKNGSVRVRSFDELRKLLNVKCRLDDVEAAVRRCRNGNMIQLRTADGVTQVTLRPSWR